LEFVEREIGGHAGHDAIASAANHPGDLLVVGHVDGVVPGVEVVLDLPRHVHAPDLERRRHPAPRHLRRHRLRMDQRIDVADAGGADDLGRPAPRPFRGVRLRALVRRALQHRGALQLVTGQMLRPALHRFVAGRAQEARHREPLRQVLVVVPAIELALRVGRYVRPDHQESRALRVRHGAPRATGAGSAMSRVVTRRSSRRYFASSTGSASYAARMSANSVSAPTGGMIRAESIEYRPGGSWNDASVCQSRLPSPYMRRRSSDFRSSPLSSTFEMSERASLPRRLLP